MILRRRGQLRLRLNGRQFYVLSLSCPTSTWLLLSICRSLGVTELRVSLRSVRATLSGLVVRPSACSLNIRPCCVDQFRLLLTVRADRALRFMPAVGRHCVCPSRHRPRRRQGESRSIPASEHRIPYPLLLAFSLCLRPHSQSRAIIERRLCLLPGALADTHDAQCLCISHRISLVTRVVQHSCHYTSSRYKCTRARSL
jgi:hypothetical protein